MERNARGSPGVVPGADEMGSASEKFTELDLQVSCSFLEAYYIHKEFYQKASGELIRSYRNQNPFFFMREYLSVIHTFQEILVFLRKSVKNLRIFPRNAN